MCNLFWRKLEFKFWTCHAWSFVASAWFYYYYYFKRLAFNVSRLSFCWNISKRLSQFIIHMSIFRLNMGAKQSVVDVESSVVWSFKAFEVGSMFRFSKCLDRLDFVIDKWFFFWGCRSLSINIKPEWEGDWTKLAASWAPSHILQG